ncbi:hypothetical protein BJX64DRAFT_269469 [Aspergillus heterothallicus]
MVMESTRQRATNIWATAGMTSSLAARPPDTDTDTKTMHTAAAYITSLITDRYSGERERV